MNRITRIWLFPLLFQNGCSQSSHFRTAGQGEQSSGNKIGRKLDDEALCMHCRPMITIFNCHFSKIQSQYRFVVVISSVKLFDEFEFKNYLSIFCTYTVEYVLNKN